MIWRKENRVEDISYDENWINTIFRQVGTSQDGGPVFMNVPVIEDRVGEELLDADRKTMQRVLIFFMEKILASIKNAGNYTPATLIVDGYQCWMAGDLRGMDFNSILIYPQLKATSVMFSEGYELLKARYPGMIKEAYLINRKLL